jgi:hypothetical protein
MSITISGAGTSGGFSSAGAFNTSPAMAGTFIPQIWSGKLNYKFYATTIFGEIANTNYEGDIKGIGDTVIINQIPDVTISDYQVGQTLAYQVPVPSKIQLNISKAKYFGVNVSDIIEYQSQPKLMDMFTNDAAKQMAIAIDTDILKMSIDTAFYNASTFSGNNIGTVCGAKSASYNLGGAGGAYAATLAGYRLGTPLTLTTSNIISTITAMSSVLDEQNVPDTDRFLVVSPYVRSLLMNSSLQQAYLTGDNMSILRNGKIGTIDRFTVYVSNLLPTATGATDFTGTALTGAVTRKCFFAGHKSGLTFASQIAKVESLPNPGDFGQLIRGLNVYGYGTIKPESLVVAQYV